MLSFALSGVNGIELPGCHDLRNHRHIFQMYTIKIRGTSNLRDQLKDYLNKKGIMAKVYFEPVHLASFYKNVLQYRTKLPMTERISSEVLTLPLYPSLSKKDMDYVAQEIRNFFKNGLKR